MTTFTMPSVLAFDRKLEPSDALMHSGNWEDISDQKAWSEIKLFERRNRAVKSNFKPEVLEDEDKLQQQIAEANLAWGDDASLAHDHNTMKLNFSLRVVSELEKPSVCNDVDFEQRYREIVEEYTHLKLSGLALRYAYNIANGRFLWRNRVGAQDIRIVVEHQEAKKEFVYSAFDFSLKETCCNDSEVARLAEVIQAGLSGEESILLNVSAYVKLGNGQRIWPSQEMILNSAKGEKSRHLFSVNGIAAMHCEKIGNALRTIDDWYPDYSETQSPIAVEAYGSVTQRGVAYRSTKNDFKTLLLKWMNEVDESKIKEEEKHFVAAMLIRGGVFGEGES